MKTGVKLLTAILLCVAGSVLAGYFYLRDRSVDLMQPSGTIGQQEKDLIVTTSVMMFAVILIVWTLCFWIAVRYRADNKKAKYTPDWDSNKILESVWWGIPIVLIGIISVMTWNSSHSLDPFKPLQSSKPPLRVQVVALQWKWLFIQPDQGIATLNNFAFPVNQPVEFSITSDAPMNSFWIPGLGGQIYAMSGMSTKLYLDATKEGVYSGYSANISGQGFANMKFAARAMSDSDYSEWASEIASKNNYLGKFEYEKIAKPSLNNPSIEYATVYSGLYDYVLSKYLAPGTHAHDIHNIEAMHHHGDYQ